MEPREVVAGKKVFATKPVSEKLREIPYQEMPSRGSTSLLPQRFLIAVVPGHHHMAECYVIHATFKTFLGLLMCKGAVCLLYLTLALSGDLACFRKASPVRTKDHSMS